jgi:hypothetical protein
MPCDLSPLACRGEVFRTCSEASGGGKIRVLLEGVHLRVEPRTESTSQCERPCGGGGRIVVTHGHGREPIA